MLEQIEYFQANALVGVDDAYPVPTIANLFEKRILRCMYYLNRYFVD